MSLSYDEEKEILRKRLLVRFRFRTLCRKVSANAFWLNAIEDKQIGTDPRRNIAIIVRRSGVKGILTLKEKSIFNTPDEHRSEKDRERLKSTINSLKCFQMIPPKFRETLLTSCNFFFFNPGRIILREGHHANAIYFLLDGEITVSKNVFSISDDKCIDEVRYALVPGDIFGLDGIIFGDKRTVSCTTAINTELLCIYKQDLSIELRKTLLVYWDNINSALKRFNYYFGHFTEQQMTECCTFSKITQYNIDDVIYDGEGKTTFFILSGQCTILQCLEMMCKTVNNQKNFTLLDVRKNTNNSKVLPQKFRNQINAKGMSSGQTQFEDSKKYIKQRNSAHVLDIKTLLEIQFFKSNKSNEEVGHIYLRKNFDAAFRLRNNFKFTKYFQDTRRKEVIFVDIATLRAGSIFAIGENMEQRSVVAKNVVQCLEIPTFWLLERPQNIGNIWQRTKIFYTVTIPSREAIFSDYQRTYMWNQHKEKIIKDLFECYSKI